LTTCLLHFDLRKMRLAPDSPEGKNCARPVMSKLSLPPRKFGSVAGNYNVQFEVVSSSTTFVANFIKFQPEILELKRLGGRAGGRTDWLYSAFETWWHTVMHGRGSEVETGDWNG
jgi:hypothetical protein